MRLVVIKNVHKSDQLNEEMKVVALVRDLIFFQGIHPGFDSRLHSYLQSLFWKRIPCKLPGAVHSSDDT